MIAEITTLLLPIEDDRVKAQGEDLLINMVLCWLLDGVRGSNEAKAE